MTDGPRLSPDAPPARAATQAIRSGPAADLEELLRKHPALATARIASAEAGEGRTLLHVVTDWPGHVPDAAAEIAAVAAAGAERVTRLSGPRTERREQL